MSDFITKLDKWAREANLSYTVSFWEASDEYEVAIHSPSHFEEYYQKRTRDFDSFLENYIEALVIKK